MMHFKVRDLKKDSKYSQQREDNSCCISGIGQFLLLSILQGVLHALSVVHLGAEFYALDIENNCEPFLIAMYLFQTNKRIDELEVITFLILDN